MATTITQGRRKDVEDYLYSWVGQDKSGKAVRGEMRAHGENVVVAQLRRQGLSFIKVKKQRIGRGRKISDKDIAIFTRQLAVMMRAGVPLLQAFDIVGKGHSNPAVQKMLLAIKVNVETGSSLNQAFRKFPDHFDDLFCNLV
jgi:type IV pilus assembly protein PilC